MINFSVQSIPVVGTITEDTSVHALSCQENRKIVRRTIAQQRRNRKINLLEKLKSAALNAQQHAYAPYSKFKVGAALEANDGNVYFGCNVENAAYPLGQCAEATAIGSMIVQGATSIKQIVIASPTETYCYPCGGCRQKIAEFADKSTPVVMITPDGKSISTTVGELLPEGFTLTPQR